MCIICLDWEKGKLTAKEAYRAIGELANGTKDQKEIEHFLELSDKILESEINEKVQNEELDSSWWTQTHEQDD